MDRPELADFLRRRREQLVPSDVGLPPGVRRRTPGLRPAVVVIPRASQQWTAPVVAGARRSGPGAAPD
ncbi:hypothetical protein [Antrihabitans spumae]